MTRALLIVDVQNDFTEGGALAVAGGDAVARGITRLLDRRADAYGLVLASRDWHDADSSNGGHIVAEPDYVDTWPVHCIAETPGAAYDPLLRLPDAAVHVFKGQGVAAYSLFEGSTADGRGALEVLRSAGVTDVDVVGIATDHCVRASALDAVTAGLRVRVLTDLVAGVAPETTERARAALAAAGVQLIPSVAMHRVQAEEWERVRDLRLRALHDEAAPLAFLDTPENAAAQPDDFWRERAAGDAAQFVAVDVDGSWIGSATVLLQQAGSVNELGVLRPVDRVVVVGVYVDPIARGTGVIDALLDACAAHAAAAGFGELFLNVHVDNARARAAYVRTGFAPTRMRFTSVIGDELEMVRTLA